ncbi:MAG: hypothetical protein COA47_05735 [Robiginitomaculum sp.]|nr:MAG: hypothetical protein COA47_05735 [Robiginitomaculum sp.]
MPGFQAFLKIFYREFARNSSPEIEIIFPSRLNFLTLSSGHDSHDMTLLEWISFDCSPQEKGRLAPSLIDGWKSFCLL